MSFILLWRIGLLRRVGTRRRGSLFLSMFTRRVRIFAFFCFFCFVCLFGKLFYKGIFLKGKIVKGNFVDFCLANMLQMNQVRIAYKGKIVLQMSDAVYVVEKIKKKQQLIKAFDFTEKGKKTNSTISGAVEDRCKEFFMNEDGRSLMFAVNRVIVMIDLVTPPYRILWTFDLKKFQSPIVTYRYDRTLNRVFAILQSGILVMISKDGKIKQLQLIDSFGIFPFNFFPLRSRGQIQLYGL